MNNLRLLCSLSAFSLYLLMFHAFPESATYHGVVVDSAKASAPVAGVLVMAGYGLERTLTDSAGYFSLEVPESGVLPRITRYKVPPISIVWNMRHRFLDLTGATEIVSVSIYRLNGARVWSAQCNTGQRVLRAPTIPFGVYLLKFTRSDNTCFTWRLLHGPQLGSCTISAPSHRASSGYDGSASAPGNGVTLSFRHDRYYPLDRQVAIAGSDEVITLHPDPRGVFFDETVVHTCSFTLNLDDSIVMEHDAPEESFIPAEFSFNGVPFGKVGLRYKGSEYSLSRCFDGNGNRSSYADCRNVSMKVKFNKYSDTARFYGMKRLNLHSMSYDNSKLREPLAYGLFRECGITTCRTVFVKVQVNGVSRGIFAGVEEIDGRFTKSRWPEYGDGNLYKEAWPNYKGKIKYRTALETNNDPEDSADVTRMVDFYNAITISTPETFAATIAPFFDLDYWLRYIVVDRAIHNSDGIMTWYTDGSWLSNHNYYLYEDEAPGGKIWLIPWDMNATFLKTDPIFDDYDVPEWNVVPESCEPMEVWGGSLAIPPNCDPLIKLTAASSWNRFVTLGEQFLAKVFTIERMNERIGRMVTQLEPFMDDDPYIDKETWENSVDWLRNTISVLRGSFDGYLRGRKAIEDTAGYFTPFPGDSGLLVSRINNFEFDPEVNIASWSRALISENSLVTVQLDTVAPLWGTGSILCSFVFNPADTGKAYSEWMTAGFSLGGETDCSGLRELRLNLQCDVPREVRIALASKVYQREGIGEGEGYCWNVVVVKRAKHFILDIHDIDYPEWVTHARPDLIDSVLATLTGITVMASPRFDNEGALDPVPDSGFVKMDNIEFVMP